MSDGCHLRQTGQRRGSPAQISLSAQCCFGPRILFPRTRSGSCTGRTDVEGLLGLFKRRTHWRDHGLPWAARVNNRIQGVKIPCMSPHKVIFKAFFHSTGPIRALPLFPSASPQPTPLALERSEVTANWGGKSWERKKQLSISLSPAKGPTCSKHWLGEKVEL